MYTYTSPLTYVLSSTKLNVTGMGRIGEVDDFKFTIHYQPGKDNYDANVLTRMLSDYMKTYTEIVPQDVLQAVAWSAKVTRLRTGDHNILPNNQVGMDKSTAPIIDIKNAEATDQVVRH